MKKITIAIDGFSSSGKSTMAKRLAKEIGYKYIDSGAMYRAVTLYALRHGMIATEGNVDRTAVVRALPQIVISFNVDAQSGVSHTVLNGEDVEREIRTLKVSNHVSPIAAIPEVRHHLVRLQQQMGADKGIVMDGRDIGTTVFPNAELKVFVDASAEERARRRMLELRQKGMEASYEDVYKNICDRDYIDTTREESPLRKAADAYVLNNDRLSQEQQNDILLKLYNQRIAEYGQNRD